MNGSGPGSVSVSASRVGTAAVPGLLAIEQSTTLTVLLPTADQPPVPTEPESESSSASASASASRSRSRSGIVLIPRPIRPIIQNQPQLQLQSQSVGIKRHRECSVINEYELHLFIDETVNLDLLIGLESEIYSKFPFNRITRCYINLFSSAADCYQSSRQQYNGEQLINRIQHQWLPWRLQKLYSNNNSIDRDISNNSDIHGDIHLDREYLFQNSVNNNRTKSTDSKEQHYNNISPLISSFGMLITATDSYFSELTFIFGLARAYQSCMISTARLFNNVEFTQKEANHELGHLFGLDHCESPCVMTYSQTVHHAITKKTKSFCTNCQQRIRSHSN